ncbi:MULTISPECIES: ArsR/SmtB family transcription factor [unclassified Pseudoclavibacter]|uniref:ArsR/SmtB family transcription factor n=1 Tax=unclassified Pseudoclavibacter TaxID=2615177 RepID=UPI000CE8A822|nr:MULTISPECIES: metalloregulator ArsR/SmtB family transcription factor [unclassified Pseudoclavibacter]MBF4549964.1 helix-turn-helix transcriptional regulator [Pseudoclavibacter sp. VKM Ac-2888]PPG03251.1 transcriptional regulator [Pseudoclavibacter sp. RFBI5]
MHADTQEDGAGSLGHIELDNPTVELAAEVFGMLADATRVRIVLVLDDGEHSVNDIAEAVGKTPASVSQHLAKLRLARIVATRQEGTRVYYRLINGHAKRLVADALFQAEHSVAGVGGADAIPPHHRRDPQPSRELRGDVDA